MASFTNIDIKKQRELRKMTAASLAEQISRDPTTIYNWEAGKSDPDPDTMYQIAEAFGDMNIWSLWMRTKYPSSYARIHPEPVGYSLPGALMSLYAAVGNVQVLQNAVLQDGADGSIECSDLAEKFHSAITELIKSAQKVSNILLNS